MFLGELSSKLVSTASIALRFIESIFEDSENQFQQSSYWPPHPDDGEPPNGEYIASFYHGLAGVAWAQLELADLGYGEVRNDYLHAIETARKSTIEGLRNFISFHNKDDYLSGLLMAELGFMVPILRLDPSEGNYKATIRLVQRNLQNPVLELLWGSSGSMLFLSSLLNSGKASPAQSSLLVEGVTFLQANLISSPTRNCKLWQQDLYDEKTCFLGAGHGFVGNSLAILQAIDYLPVEDARYWRKLIKETAIHTADTHGGLTNWKQSVDSHREGRTDWLLQFCHGSPGVVACLARLMGDDLNFDQLMLNAGELIWKAGPLAKGAGFCHGTSGNGWAFLKLFEATKNEMWLDRAKTFAACAVKQSEQRTLDYGDRRYSLWTGDHGVAFFTDACVSHSFSIPGLERF